MSLGILSPCGQSRPHKTDNTGRAVVLRALILKAWKSQDSISVLGASPALPTLAMQEVRRRPCPAHSETPRLPDAQGSPTPPDCHSQGALPGKRRPPDRAASPDGGGSSGYGGESNSQLVDASGRPFEEHFTLSSTKLGDGMTACVFVCNDRATGALRACKVAERRGQRPAWSRLCQLLLHESSLLQEIGIHPNVVRWEGCFTSNHRIAIVMELVSGGDCQQMLQRHGSLPEETVRGMMLQLHSALRCARTAALLHPAGPFADGEPYRLSRRRGTPRTRPPPCRPTRRLTPPVVPALPVPPAARARAAASTHSASYTATSSSKTCCATRRCARPA